MQLSTEVSFAMQNIQGNLLIIYCPSMRSLLNFSDVMKDSEVHRSVY